MSNFEYENRYGERILTDEQEDRIAERLYYEDLETAISQIKGVIPPKDAKLTKEELEDTIAEIAWIVEGIE